MCCASIRESLLNLGENGGTMSAIFLLILLQLIGESIVQVSGLPVPGAIIGLILLYAILVWRGEISDEMSRTSGFLLQNLGVLFVPAGVGVIAYLPMIAAQWWIILLVLLVSVCATVGVTGLVVTRLSPRGIEAVEAAARS
jgi:holin-like protein